MKKIKKSVWFCLPIVLLLFISIISSCNNNKETTNENVAKEGDQIVGKTFKVPDSIQLFTPFTDYLLDSSEMFDSKIKIFSYINVSCATCLDEIGKWNAIANEIKQFKVPIILVLQSKDRYEILKYLIEQGQLKPYSYPFVFDVKDNYFKSNGFLSESAKLYTVLTDSDNKILWVGDPMHSETVKQDLLTTVSHLVK